MIAFDGAEAVLVFDKSRCNVTLTGKWCRRMVEMAERELDLAVQKQAFDEKVRILQKQSVMVDGEKHA